MILSIVSKSRFFLLIAVASLLASCDDGLLSVKVPLRKTISFSIDSTQLKTSDSLLHIEEVTLNLDSLITAYGGNPADVNSGKVKSVQTTIINPPGINFGFVNFLSISVQKNPDPAVLIARAVNNGSPSSELSFQILNNTNVLDYIQTNVPFTIAIYGSINQPLPSAQVKLSIQITWEIDASPF